MGKFSGKIKVIAYLLVCVLIGAGAFLYGKHNKKAEVPVMQAQDNAADSISKAKILLEKDSCKEAEVIKDVKTSEKVIALTFQGLSDMETNKQILKLLDTYKRKASFFVPGILAAEDSESIAAMYTKGHRVESNTLSETKHMEKFTKEELVEDFCKTNHIIQSAVNMAPEVLLCNSTKYSKELLKAAYASGNQKVIKSTHYLNYQSFHSYEQVLAYVKNLEKGSILTFKMKGVLDEDEYVPAEREATPAIDKAPDKDKEDTESTAESLTEEERLLLAVEWVLKALDDTNYHTVFAEDLKSYSDSDYEIKFSELRKRNQGALAKVYKNAETEDPMLSLSFRGIEEEERLNEILDFLDFNHLQATFFVTADDIINYPDRIQAILDKNQCIANGGMSGKDLTSMDFDEICLEIYKCHKLLMEKYLINSNIFMPVYGKYNDLVLEAASALDYKVVTYNKIPITSGAAALNDIMDKYKNGYSKGDIVYFNIGLHKQLLNVITQTYAFYIKDNFNVYDVETLIDGTGNGLNNKAEGKDTGAGLYHTYTTGGYVKSYGSPAPQAVSSIVKGPIVKNTVTNTGKPAAKAEKKSYTKKELNTLRKKNKGKKAEVINTVHTTEQALSFTFYGVSNTTVTDDVLQKLDSIKAKGTFFVTENDLKNDRKEIKKIAKKGHEIGICLVVPEGANFYSVCSSILSVQSQVKTLTGKKPSLVRYAYTVDMTDEMLEAISSTGCKVAGQNLALTSSRLGVDATLDDVIRYAFNSGNITVKRGYIIFIRMDYYEDPYLIGNLILNIVKNRIEPITYYDGLVNNGSSYSIKTLGSLLASDKVYTYPLSGNAILPSAKDAIYPGHLLPLDSQKQFEYMKGRYIGNPDVNTIASLPGFDITEVGNLNQTGRFTNERVLFLTFDDWGSDKPISQLLYVLNKYKVKGTFFVRTNYIQDNPNLLRAIAEAGHAVGSHTDKHLPFANSKADVYDISANFTSLTGEEINIRKSDLLVSYQKLQGMIGDVEVNGIPSLTKILRPPTLAMSKGGMEAIFDMGFQYIISGDYSTHDYAESDPEVLADNIVNGLKRNDGSVQPLCNGSILVLHMSDDSFTPSQKADTTAQALDIAIPRLLAQGYKFARLSDYLSDGTGAIQ